MFPFGPRRSWILAGVVAAWLVGIVVIFSSHAFKRETLVISHWANGHMAAASLLPAFAREFNDANHLTPSGKLIEIRPIEVNSGAITCQLIRRVNPGTGCPENEGTGGRDADKHPDPVIVTPAADHWLGEVNHAVGRDVIDLSTTPSLAKTYIGIATLREMAQCLGWPEREVGLSDIITLRANPDGWASCPTARAEWGRTPLLSFTDPDSSSTGRSMVFTLFSLAAGKSPDQLTRADVTQPHVLEYVRRFQRGVDHYVPDTLILNSKIYLGPRYGHFFLIAEDNLIKLYQGKVEIEDVNGKSRRNLERDMVFIYPKEGSPGHNHSAAVVRADWVSPEHTEAAGQWITFLLEEKQQQAIMQEGFRPGSGIPYVRPAGSRFWPDPNKPTITLEPDRIEPSAARTIVESWGTVKKPGVVTVVVDTSGSMSGEKLEQAQAGTIRMLDNIDRANKVGFLTFSDGINERVPVSPVAEARYTIVEAVKRMRASGNTAVFTALQEAIRMTDDAEADPDATRGVVILTDGRANRGVPLHNIVNVMSRNEEQLKSCSGFDSVLGCSTVPNAPLVPKKDVLGVDMALTTKHPIHIFYVGIGADADLDVGRILAEATHSAYRGTTAGTLASVLEAFGKYF